MSAQNEEPNLGKNNPAILSFASLVKRMRTAQTKYFKTRDSDYLVESKVLERAVDDEINNILPNT